jgi:peptidoglycan/LPS O-acetylase OafA/YrhL
VQPPPIALKLFTLLGGISYALYVVHYPIYEFMKRVSWSVPAIRDAGILTGTTILLAAMLLSYLAERYYDRPVRAWLGSLARRSEGRKSMPVSDGAPIES